MEEFNYKFNDTADTLYSRTSHLISPSIVDGCDGYPLSAYGNYLLVKRKKKFMARMKYPPQRLLLVNIRLTASDILYLRVNGQLAQTGFVPADFRLVLMNCHLAGIDWCRLGCS
ncbi:hypothetical protein RvY_14249 [Ramazzottius varieornatus]|uniref:Uncharacterized protein n=1 Tax=Ramazzottius varieornatus TaxID=947166 RepID=A0A1D1VQP8_RAMVA|nr:hypothetical protein RvY_14249 [Ramazzottius varieornatus]